MEIEFDSEKSFERLVDALDYLPNGFPRTPSRIEIQILKKIFSPEEAAIANHLTGKWQPVEAIAADAGLPDIKAKSLLIAIAKRGLVWFDKVDDKMCFRLAPFIVGIYEAQVENMDHELAHLVEKYMAEGGAAGIMHPQPAIHRVIPAQNTVKSEWILPYDDVRAILLNAKSFTNGDCICRLQQEQVGRRCTFPTNLCLSFSPYERNESPGSISQAEALAILDKTEQFGLVHTVSNVMHGMGYICNCCGCCCGILRGITDWGIADSVAFANYYANIDPDRCLACGTCIERCQVHAISEQDGISYVNRARCIGCGLCVSGCPNDAASLLRKPENEIVNPPDDYSAWEQARRLSRNLAH
jgi:Na+-translocating ferredoxin:NAD+ oxidoreductase subunit B